MSVRIAAPLPRSGLPLPDRRRLRAGAERLLDALCHRASELSIALVDDAGISALNRDFRAVDAPTDVLAFPLQEGEGADRAVPLLGDVVVALETALRQARRRGTSLDAEVMRLLVHGVLHLLGHDHAHPAETRAMRAEERRLLAVLRS